MTICFIKKLFFLISHDYEAFCKKFKISVANPDELWYPI